MRVPLMFPLSVLFIYRRAKLLHLVGLYSHSNIEMEYDI